MKKIYALTFILGILVNLSAQKAGDVDINFATNGIHVEPSTLYTDDAEIEIDGDGKILVGGTLIINDDTTVFVMRFNSEGTKDMSFSGTSASILDMGPKGAYLKDMKVLPDGKIILCGHYSDSQECFAARLTSTGALDATFGAGGVMNLDISADSTEHTINIEPYIGDTYLISGHAYETGKTGGKDIFLLKILNNGIIDNSFNSGEPIYYDSPFSDDDNNVGLLIETDNKIIISGYYIYKDNNTLYLSIQRINSDGTVDPTISYGINTNIGIYNFGNGVNTFYHDIIKDANGGFFLSGYVAEAGSANYDFFTLNANSDGEVNRDFGLENPYWATTRFDLNDASGYDNGRKLIMLENNKLIFVGFSPNSNDGNVEVSLLGLNQDGTINADFGNNGVTFLDIQGAEDRALDAAYNADENKIYVTGKSWDESLNKYELFITAFHTEDVVSSVNEVEAGNIFDIYPNPANDRVQITLTEIPNKDSEFTIYDSKGAEILKQEIKSDNTILDIARFPKGLYFISVNINSQMFTRTLIKQ